MTKKVLFLLHLPPPVHGSSMVGKFIFESKIINGSFNSQYLNLLASKNTAASGKPSLNKAIGFIVIWFRLLVKLIKQRPDICYFALTTTGFAFYRDVFLVFLLKIFRVKRIYHLHNKGIRQKQNSFIHAVFYRYVFHSSDVILLSKHLFADIQDFVARENVYICPNGIPEINSVKNKEIYLTENVRILFLSNLIESKGVYNLLDALAIVKQRGISFQCDFIGAEGDITFQQFQDKVNRLEISNQVKYLGEKFNEDKNKAFMESDIFVFPTYHETFGLVNLEAMQFALPVISTWEGGIPDVVENNVTGFLVQPKDTEALAEKLEKLILNPQLRKKMGLAGRKKYEKEFTLEIFEKNLVNILNKVLEK
ncbi:glycosyltransferase [Anaerophaga thermohalophila]|uniref:glycosyltransferase n=1 Tax=Anaerophaga thermohalophila TaxID=177400 RepID=UPI000237CE02|nr:glycosyltransferase [Anaerophaga thermohalophila]